MNKNMIIGAVVAVAVVGAGAYLLTGKGGQGGAESVTPPQATTSSLKELIASGVAQKCVFTDEQVPSSGTVYIGNGKIRGDFYATANGEQKHIQMITDGTTMHTWFDGMTTGFKLSVAVPSAAGTPAPAQNIDLDKTLEYSCLPWTVEDSVFALPTAINFVDINAMGAGIPQF